ncbi:MAG: alpha/beta fold hydrolase [Sediminibacterium sp.]|nr:alpha/beta fold hydrolase [Sediminibacterium sp.]
MSMVLFALLAAFTFAGCEKELKLNEPGSLVPKTVTEDPLLPAISVNNTKLHSETFGNPDSPMVVILHGGPGADYRSMLNCKTLASDGYFVVFYDQRGSGLSQRHDKSTYSIQLMLDDLTTVINYYRKSPNQKIFLLGHSWGAMLATAYVNTYPTTIRGVIMAEPGGFTWEQTDKYLSRTRKINPLNESTNDALYFDQILTGKENEHEVLDYKLAISSAFGSKEGNVLGNAGTYPFWRMGAITLTALIEIASKDGFNWTTNLSQFSTKVLFCYSELNKAYGLNHAQLLSSAYPNVQLEKINGAGHEIVYFGWNNFYPLAKTYLNSLR